MNWLLLIAAAAIIGTFFSFLLVKVEFTSREIEPGSIHYLKSGEYFK